MRNAVQISQLKTVPGETTIVLSAAQQAQISTDLKASCNHISQEMHPHTLAVKAEEIILKHLNHVQREIVKQFSDHGDSPYLIIRSLVSLENLPPTPTDDQSPVEQSWREQAACLLGLLAACGATAASFEDEMGGRLCHMVMPAKNSEASYSRSTKQLNFHTEVVNGYFAEELPSHGKPLSPDVFGLACLRNPHGTSTTLLPIQPILDSLSIIDIEDLSRPEFSAYSQSSFDREIVIKAVPVLIRQKNGLMGMRYSNSKLQPLTDRAEKALVTLKGHISTSPFESIALQPGDALILNNRICLHGRSALNGTARFDGTDRWLIRIYGYHPRAKAHMRVIANKVHVMLLDA